jgi:hypothetical protein
MHPEGNLYIMEARGLFAGQGTLEMHSTCSGICNCRPHNFLVQTMYHGTWFDVGVGSKFVYREGLGDVCRQRKNGSVI